MKKIWKILIAVAVVLTVIVFAFMNYTKSHSSAETVKFEKNDLKIQVNYCRPAVKEREIFGGLVPFGKIWRTGANEATLISFSKDVTVAGKAVPAGKYTLWTIPNERNWTIIINKETGQWGTNYDEAEDLLRVDVAAETTAEKVELFTITTTNSDTGASLTLAWDKTKVSVPIQ